MGTGLSGIFNAQRSLMINQTAINLISQNISNINTPGYTRQRLEISQVPVLGAGVNQNSNSGYTQIDAITRNRDVYFDSYYRTKNSDKSYFEELNNNTSLIEGITDQFSNSGLTSALNEFYNSAQQLSLNPTDPVARTDFVQRATDVADTFNQTYSSLNNLRTSIVGDGSDQNTLNTSKIGLACTDLNNKLGAFAELNKNINIATSQGLAPNALLDERDRLTDEISKYIPITVTNEANNLQKISLNSVDLVRGGSQIGFISAAVTSPTDHDNPVTIKIKDSNEPSANTIVSDAKSIITSGKIGAMLEIGGTDSATLTINNIIKDLNTLAKNFATQVNNIQNYTKTVPAIDPVSGNPVLDGLGNPMLQITESSMCLDKSTTPPQLQRATQPIFLDQNDPLLLNNANITAGNIRINSAVVSDPFKIATARGNMVPVDPLHPEGAAKPADPTAVGDGKNALLIAQVRNANISALNGSTTEKFITSMIGNLGVQSKSIQDKYLAQSTILDQASNKRESSTGVNLDEELMELVKFQKAYEASAKVFTVYDQTLQQLMALVR